MSEAGNYSEIVTALRMCGYPGSVYWCSHGCPFSVNGGTCELHALRSAAASAIDDLGERLQDYRTAVRRVYEAVGGDAQRPTDNRLMFDARAADSRPYEEAEAEA